MVLKFLNRDQECGVLEMFKDLDGVLILSVLENGGLMNKITFNGGYIWSDFEIYSGDSSDICKSVIFI